MITSQPMTADELLRLPDDGHRYELIRGELKRMSPGGEEHSQVGVTFILVVGSFVRTRKLGRVYGPDLGFVLAESPDTVRSPKEPLILHADDILDGGDILPSFRAPVADFFPSR